MFLSLENMKPVNKLSKTVKRLKISESISSVGQNRNSHSPLCLATSEKSGNIPVLLENFGDRVKDCIVFILLIELWTLTSPLQAANV